MILSTKVTPPIRKTMLMKHHPTLIFDERKTTSMHSCTHKSPKPIKAGTNDNATEYFMLFH
jgi:hypothetical protein